MLTRDAPAKINLALHVTGRRPDGYHLLESLVVFTELGDRVSAGAAEDDSFALEGPEAGTLAAEDSQGNLVVRARDALRKAAQRSGHAAPPVAITLDKRLPVASGIGGGSADAAATLTLLSDLWGYHPSAQELAEIGLSLGADVPMCLAGTPLVARGIGEALEPVEFGFALDMVLVNPRIGVSTPTVFKALARRDNAPLPPVEGLEDRARFLGWLETVRNDLEAPARQIAPAIGDCLSALSDTGALLARMSGSGASCFGIHADADAAAEAARRLRQAYPGWFVAATRTRSAPGRQVRQAS
ncbi:4-(cytidine 5'-diphospho)-2-C-methyl-D-erythritol kinase [Hoeflea olei]|uniref:4-diphosphocytidyl-2-C-methyl-D-erythritol kinase n=1 Tax=Hoeflea olei TaxID=1480615 RepID=A0A1C1YPT5_9HYPH|nr:4-(cytidine 5'-diphospho)-2-C-methyl-D-erythritol kinase [Hoeflea olei]OCW55573.1 4-diphosphocytidyl-2C-methyl-D-erythritol kinase [Hoeflea olei]